MTASRTGVVALALLTGLLALAGCGARPAAAAPGEGCWHGAQAGTAVCGPPLHLAALPGHVVWWTYWGVQCPPCLAHIALFARTQAAHPQDLIVVADHLQDGTPPAVARVWHAHGGGDQVRVVADAEVPGVTVTQLPRCLVVDRHGVIRYDGDPDGAVPVIDRLLARAADPASPAR